MPSLYLFPLPFLSSHVIGNWSDLFNASSASNCCAMLSFEMKRSELAVGIRPHWDQTFVDPELRRLSAEILSRLHEESAYQNVGTVRQMAPRDRRCSARKTCARQEDEFSRYYVNLPRCPDNLVAPKNGAGNVSLRMDLSPMSPRAPVADMATGQFPAVVQVALARLSESGFYYGSISPSEARQLLEPHLPGTFLVRASSDHRFFCSLTVRTSGMYAMNTSAFILPA